MTGDFTSFKTDIYDALTGAVAAPSHPAVIGWNYEAYRTMNASDQAAFRARIIDSDAHGVITTMHWPLGNFTISCSPNACGDNDNQDGVDPVHLIVARADYLIDGVTKNAGVEFDAMLAELGTFLASLKNAAGQPIPIIFRPFHEMNSRKPGGTAHWWSGRTPAEFKQLWARVVDGLRHDQGLRHVMFAFSPRAEPLFASGVPLDNYALYWPEGADASTADQRFVDIAAFDSYLQDSDDASLLGRTIDVTAQFAAASSRSIARVVAIAETGRKDGTNSPTNGGNVDYQNGPFWMQRIAPALSTHWGQIAYLATWTNRSSSNFSTYPGAPLAQANDFVQWFNLPQTAFLDEVPSF